MSTDVIKTAEDQRTQEAHDMTQKCRAWNTEAEKLWALHRAITMDAGSAASEKLADIMGHQPEATEFWTPTEKAPLKALYYKKLMAL